MKVTFDVSREKDGPKKSVTLEVITTETDVEWLIEKALASQIIVWQGQIRKNWSSPIPATVKLHEGLVASSKGTTIIKRAMTPEEMKSHLGTLSQEERQAFIESLMAAM